MKKTRLLSLLVLLLTAVTGAWADGQELKVKIISEEMATPWLQDDGSTMLATKDLPDFYPVTEDEAMAWADVPQDGTVFLIYAFDDPDEGSAVHYVRFDNGECTGSDQQDASIYSIAYSITDQGVKFYYTYAFSAKLAANTKDAKNWTIASGENSVAGNVEAGLTGLSEGDAVTLTYTGHLKLKGIKAATDAAPAGPKAAKDATAEDLGKVIGTDGNIYDDADAATAANTTAVAMIAYVGTASDCAHGLAIALADESGTKNYGDAGTACSGKAAVTGGTWRLPSEKDWQYMFIGCGSSEAYSAPTYDPFMSKSYSGLASKLTTAQGAALQSDFYWSSTEDDPNGAWGVVFNGSNATFYNEDETSEHQVRACLAF
jgi:hypothetical protein